ncbi:amidase domain-containing protein [Thermohalobacter berrensis]|uniref:Amidase n=1 Tax=Thermohalobacter berrensis TaxID=99594 RepID=A0A419T4W2_9FIRM|nr:amidase domain-containing protein [Thermohalobacter berrensis]RKD32570.1 amidase [Thermohalobacter berrensis]
MKGQFNKTFTKLYPYDRNKAYNYAKRWSFDRNPKYYDFEHLGGDCTNFISQVLHAGGCPMNYKKWTGWYYKNLNERSPSWTGVNFLYEFLINNSERGPIAEKGDINKLQIGDIIQLDFDGDGSFEHSLVVVKINKPISLDNIFISTHTYDRFNYPLSNYTYSDIRFIHILGYKY